MQINVGKVRTHISTLGMLKGSHLFLVIAQVNSLQLPPSLSSHKPIQFKFILQSEDRQSKIRNTSQRGFRQALLFVLGIIYDHTCNNVAFLFYRGSASIVLVESAETYSFTTPVISFLDDGCVPLLLQVPCLTRF